MEARWIACAVLLAAAGAAPAQEMEIRLAEKVNIAAEAGHAEFEAFGRHFSMELESNERALARLPASRKAEIAGIRLLRGTLSGEPGTWVRLTETGGQYEGAIWDGRDLYSVTRHERVAPFPEK